MTALLYPTTLNCTQKTLDAQLLAGVTAAVTLNNVVGIQNKAGVFVVDRVDANKNETASKREYITFTGVSGSTLTGLVRNADGGGTDQDHAVGAIIEFVSDVLQQQAILDALLLMVTTSGVQIATADGWTLANETWTYASASTITVPAGAAAKYQKGDKIKLTQTTVKYFYVVGVANTVLTVVGNGAVVVTNAVISANYYSHASSPVGFPDIFTYTPVITGSVGNPTTGNGGLYGEFRLSGTHCSLRIVFFDGTTTDEGSGDYSWTVPVAAYNASELDDGWGADIYVGVGRCRDAGTANYLGVASLLTSTNKLLVNTPGANTQWGHAVPITFAHGDYMDIQIEYQIA